MFSNKWYFLKGESGVGKSYLLKNLLKLQNINLSSIKVRNEMNLKELRLNIKDYWSLFGYADQDIKLLNTPILLSEYPFHPHFSISQAAGIFIELLLTL